MIPGQILLQEIIKMWTAEEKAAVSALAALRKTWLSRSAASIIKILEFALCIFALFILKLTGPPTESLYFQCWLGFLIIFNISYSIQLHMHRRGFIVARFKLSIIQREAVSRVLSLRLSMDKEAGLRTLWPGSRSFSTSPFVLPLCVWLAACEEQPSVWEESSCLGCLFVVRNKSIPSFFFRTPEARWECFDRSCFRFGRTDFIWLYRAVRAEWGRLVELMISGVYPWQPEFEAVVSCHSRL